jgi:hypothetical protein
MKSNGLLSKRAQIDKSQALVVAVVASAAFIVVFSLVSAKALLKQRAYQARVIAKQEKARDQLKANKEAVDQLVVSYKDFVGAPDNLIGGNPTGTGDRDGDNAKIILDALPSKYDFPAVASSLEKILTEKQFQIGSISGTDDELAQSAKQSSANPRPVEIPVQFSVTGSYTSIQDLIGVLEKSIRPFNIQTLTLAGDPGSLKIDLKANTYYQPEKALDIQKEIVK